ncbi:MAG: hypothetical protein AB7K24_08890 [Gemmataceae bacterium]
MIIPLSQSYPSRTGVPVLSQVDEDIFRCKYFRHCMACTFCHDSCCSYGVDVDIENVKRLEAHADGLQALVGQPSSSWFHTRFARDDEFPGGKFTRTRVVDGACVFLDRKGRGCLIHRYCLEQGLDYHELKPLVSCLFPLTFGHGVLTIAEEVEDNSLICVNIGESVYRGVRDDLLYYFGDGLVAELDDLENAYTSEK